MSENNFNLEISRIRSINDANIHLGGITIISGENGSGKSTISKLTYNIIKTSIEYEEIIDNKLSEELSNITKKLDLLSREFSYFFDKNEYLKIRSIFKKPYREEHQLSLFEEKENISQSLNYIIDRIQENISFDTEKFENARIERVKNILLDSFPQVSKNKSHSIKELLIELRDSLNSSVLKFNDLKEIRHTDILDEVIESAFNDSSFPNTYNLSEYNVNIIDRKKKKILPVHGFENIAYIDTPMILGIEFHGERNHWDDTNELLTIRKKNKSIPIIDDIFENQIIQGVVKIDEDDFFESSMIYKRSDGREFNLLECATGLKSFAILQLLYKNGFLNSKTLLIIDEPEAHLHPQWIVEYARLIVLLNKHLDVKFLIASHNPDMISAIKYISEKEILKNKLNFYLAVKIKNTFTYNYQHLGDNIDEIFASFNIALERIDLYGNTQ